MTILPKKKVPKDKNEDNREAPRSPNGENQRSGHRRPPSSPSHWSHNSNLNDDHGGRYEDKHHESSHKRRHRLSPHRTVRKQRHIERPNRNDRQLSRPVWVETDPEASAHSSRTYGESSENFGRDSRGCEEEGRNSEDEYPDPSHAMVDPYSQTRSKTEV